MLKLWRCTRQLKTYSPHREEVRMAKWRQEPAWADNSLVQSIVGTLLFEGNARPVCQMQTMGLWGLPVVPFPRKQWRQNLSMVPNFRLQTNCICCCFVSNSKAEAVSPRHRYSIWPFIISEAAWTSGFSLVTGRLCQGQRKHFPVHLIIKASLCIWPKGQLT